MPGGLFVCAVCLYDRSGKGQAGLAMGEFGEAVGTATEGGLFARSVSGKAGGLTDKAGHPIKQGHFAEDACLNCGTVLLGEHCHACGQQAHLHRTIGAFLHDLSHGVLHLDGKIWRTLPLLIFKPGELTRRYIEGERAKFVSPMALFLFSVFLMFAVFQALGITAPTRLDPPDLGDRIVTVDSDVAEKRDALRQRIAAMAPGDPARAEAEEDLAGLETALSGVEQVRRLGEGDTGNLDVNFTGIQAIDEGLVRKWRENPGLMLYKLQTNAYKFSWLLIPLSVPFLWFMFAWKRGVKAYDHAIFVTYSIAFMSLLFIALSLLSMNGLGGGWVFAALAVVPPLHLYKQLRKAYGLSRFSALWRLLILLVFILVVILLFLQILLLLGTT